MRIVLVVPVRPGTRHGNKVTGLRWARLLRQLGHRVTVASEYFAQPADLLIALHARRSHISVQRFRVHYPHRPIIVALTGTDLYRDLPRNRQARSSLQMANWLVALQPMARLRIPPELRRKLRVIFQSGTPWDAHHLPRSKARMRPKVTSDLFRVCVVGHLRWEKDPFRTAFASRGLPMQSNIRVLQAGRALNTRFAKLARAEETRNSRYRWLGQLGPGGVRQLMSQCQLMVLSSRMEGGANVITEAVLAGLPVLASRIPGNVGLLGSSYPGYFPAGNHRALRGLLSRAESKPGYLKLLKSYILELTPRFSPAREERAWRKLLSNCFARAKR